MPTALPSFIRSANVLRKVRTSKLEPAIMDSLNRQAFSSRKRERENLPRVLDRPRRFTIDSIRAVKAQRVAGGFQSAVAVAPKMNAILTRLEEGGTESEGLTIEERSLANAYGDLGQRGILNILRKDRKSRRISSATKAKKAAAAAKAPKGAAAKARARARKAGKTIYRGTVFTGKNGRKLENPNDRYFVAKIGRTEGLWERKAGKRTRLTGRSSIRRDRMRLLVAFHKNPRWREQLGFRTTARTNARRYNELVRDAFERAVAAAESEVL